MKSVNVFKCPDDATTEQYGTVVSFGINRNTAVYNSSGTGADGMTLAQFTAPAKTVLLFEVVNSTGYDITKPYQAWSPTNAQGDDFGNAGWSGGSPSGCGQGSVWDMAGYNSNTSNANHLAYATGYLANSTGVSSPYFANTKNGRHNNGSNFVLADGHAKFFLPSAVSGGWPGEAPGGCGTPGGVAASVDCSDKSIAATFSVN